MGPIRPFLGRQALFQPCLNCHGSRFPQAIHRLKPRLGGFWDCQNRLFECSRAVFRIQLFPYWMVRSEALGYLMR